MPLAAGYHEAAPVADRNIERQWRFLATKPGTAVILPDGRCDIMLRFRHTAQGRVSGVTPVVTGPATRPYTVAFAAGDGWLGLRLRPERAVDLWGNRLAQAPEAVLRDRAAVDVMPVIDPQGATRLATLEALVAQWPGCLRAQGTATPRMARALDMVHVAGGRLPVAQLADVMGLGPRQLGRMFRAHVGVAPKTYGQVVQFHRALMLITQQGLGVAAAAIEAGYADQPHMTRAFRRFGGFSPGAIPEQINLPQLPI